MGATHYPPRFAQADAFDAGYVLDWLSRILEARDERLTRFRALLR